MTSIHDDLNLVNLVNLKTGLVHQDRFVRALQPICNGEVLTHAYVEVQKALENYKNTGTTNLQLMDWVLYIRGVGATENRLRSSKTRAKENMIAIATIVEYLLAEIGELAGIDVKAAGRKLVMQKDIRIVIQRDRELPQVHFVSKSYIV